MSVTATHVKMVQHVLMQSTDIRVHAHQDIQEQTAKQVGTLSSYILSLIFSREFCLESFQDKFYCKGAIVYKNIARDFGVLEISHNSQRF